MNQTAANRTSDIISRLDRKPSQTTESLISEAMTRIEMKERPIPKVCIVCGNAAKPLEPGFNTCKGCTTQADREEPLFRKHVSTCGYLKSGKDQTPCDCAAQANHPWMRQESARLKFTLQIDLGDDSKVVTGQDVINALKDSLKGEAKLGFEAGVGGSLWDADGNTVGKWQVTDNSLEAIRKRIIAEDGPYA